MMLVGRAVYGAGCESLYVTQTTILAQWFKGNSMSLALALLVVSTRSASVVNSVVGPDMPSPQFAFLVGFFLCLTSWISAAVLVYAHKS
jgi:MFS family permease